MALQFSHSYKDTARIPLLWHVKAETFRFKQFGVAHHAQAGLKVTTDSVFFGAWAPLDGTGPILDIGAGTGLLGLMAAQRCPHASPIHLLEPQPEAAGLARQNAQASPWADRLSVIETRLEDYRPTLAYTDILCNPPFFVESLQRQDSTLSTALHADKDLLARWVEAALPLLAKEGRLHLMLLPEARIQVLKLCLKLGLYVWQEGFLHHSPAHAPMRWVGCLGRTDAPVPRRPNWYVKGEDGLPEPRYAELVRPFYLSI